MKQILLFLLIFFCFTQCKYENSRSELENIHKFIDTINITNTNSYIKYKFALSKRYPSYLKTYLIDSIKATEDIKNNHLVYPYEELNYLISFNQFKKTLKENYGINTIEDISGCIVDDSSEYEKGYTKIMKAEIKNRFGENFIQKLIIESDSIYYQQNKDLVYDLHNSYAALKCYQSEKYSTYFDSIRNSIKTSLKYPKDYKFKNEDAYTYTSAEFVLNKNGSIDSLDVESSFQNVENEKFRSFFEKQVRDYFEKTSLLPIKVYGMKINTKQDFTIYHK